MKRPIVITFLSLALLGIFCAFLGGCNLHKHCARTLRDSTRIHDSTIVYEKMIPIERDSIVFKDSVPCKDFILDLSGGNGLHTSIVVKAGKAAIKTLGPDSAKGRVTEHFHSEKKERVEQCPPCPDCPTNWYDPYCRWWMIISLAAAAGIGAWKAAKRFYKPV